MVCVKSFVVASLLGVSFGKHAGKHAKSSLRAVPAATTTEELFIEPMGSGVVRTTVAFNRDANGAMKLVKGKVRAECKTALESLAYQVTIPTGAEAPWYNEFVKTCKGATFEVTVTHHFDTAPTCPGKAQSYLLDPTPSIRGLNRIDGKQVTAMLHGVNCVEAGGVDGVYMITNGASDICSSKLDKPSTSLGRITWSGSAPGIPARVTVLANKTWKPQAFVIDAGTCQVDPAELDLVSEEEMQLKGASAIFGATAVATIAATTIALL